MKKEFMILIFGLIFLSGCITPNNPTPEECAEQGLLRTYISHPRENNTDSPPQIFRCLPGPTCTPQNCTLNTPEPCKYGWLNTSIYSLTLQNDLSGSMSGSMGGSFFLGIGSVSGSISGEMHETSNYYFYEKDKYGGLFISKIGADKATIYYTNETSYISTWGYTDSRQIAKPFYSLKQQSVEHLCMRPVEYSTKMCSNSDGWYWDCGENIGAFQIGTKRLYIPESSIQLEFNPNMR